MAVRLTKRNLTSHDNPNHEREVPSLPEESFGHCIRRDSKSGQGKLSCTTKKKTTLADGLCMSCWDKMVGQASPAEDEKYGRTSNLKAESETPVGRPKGWKSVKKSKSGPKLTNGHVTYR
ncbi:hypothetical protein CMI37_05965 [Candidatus Pacearchaeota archaeon]|nr:hypothetical protein [Candidatus Pacearchaeota archaeon]